MTHADDEELHAEKRRRGGFLVRSALSLVSTSVVTAGLGFIFWTVAARMFSASDVGESATAIAAMSLIAPFSLLGFGTALIAKLPSMSSGRAQLVSSAALVCAVVGGLVALVCALVLPTSFLGLPGIGHDLHTTLIFMGGVSAHSVAMMLDVALLSVVGGGIQLKRNVVHAVVKLVLLVVFALTLPRYGPLSIYASWFVASVASIAVVGVLLLRQQRVPAGRILPRFSAIRALRLQALEHHVLNLALVAPFFAMPIVANVVLGSEDAGYLYATWSLAGFVFVLPIAMSTALFASAARDSSTIVTEFRFSLRNSMAACGAANLLILPLGGLVLSIFGEAYAANGRTVLTVLCVGGLGLVIRDHHVAVARITGDVGREAVLMVMLGTAELVGAAIGASRGGLLGLGLGWLAAVGFAVMICTPRVWCAYRGRLEVAAGRGLDGAAEAGH